MVRIIFAVVEVEVLLLEVVVGGVANVLGVIEVVEFVELFDVFVVICVAWEGEEILAS